MPSCLGNVDTTEVLWMLENGFSSDGHDKAECPLKACGVCLSSGFNMVLTFCWQNEEKWQILIFFSSFLFFSFFFPSPRWRHTQGFLVRCFITLPFPPVSTTRREASLVLSLIHPEPLGFSSRCRTQLPAVSWGELCSGHWLYRITE